MKNLLGGGAALAKIQCAVHQAQNQHQCCQKHRPDSSMPQISDCKSRYSQHFLFHFSFLPFLTFCSENPRNFPIIRKNVPRHFPNIQDKRGASTHPRVQSSSTSFIYVSDYFVLTFSASGCHAVSTTLSTVQSEVMIPASM